MFLDLTLRRNPTLVEQAIALHQTGRIPANCYVIDLDAVDHNAGVIAREAARHGLKTFAMTKQMGRNGSFCRAVARGGIPAAVAVDMECARACHRAGMTIGHLGHLVQIPRHEADAAASMTPDYWTVFAAEKAQEASDASLKRQRVQPAKNTGKRVMRRNPMRQFQNHLQHGFIAQPPDFHRRPSFRATQHRHHGNGQNIGQRMNSVVRPMVANAVEKAQ